MSKIFVCGSLLKVYCFFPKASLFFLVNFACHRIYFTLSREKKVAQFHKKTRDQSEKKNSCVRELARSEVQSAQSVLSSVCFGDCQLDFDNMNKFKSSQKKI